jgi:hypothetical protein
VSQPRKHHYIPICYLKQWANTPDRRLCEYKSIPNYGVKPRRTFPDGTGYQIDLYRADGLPEAIAQDFEKEFMHPVDTDASLALKKILAGNTDNWTGDLRSGWTRFIVSLLFRNPETVAMFKNLILGMWDNVLEAEHAAGGKTKDIEEYRAKVAPQVQIEAANFLAEVIDDQKIGPAIFGMQWSSVDLSRSSFELVTSDRPLDMPFGLGDPNAYISLPVSPRILFVAAHRPSIAEAMRKANPTQIARANNQLVTQRARKFVWSALVKNVARAFAKWETKRHGELDAVRMSLACAREQSRGVPSAH